MTKSNLTKYNQKRNFTKTPEPEGKEQRTKTGFSYLIQKHEASHLHYDFRLELNGTLKSWAVTKGPSLDPTVKRLAVEVEDHPVAYGSFEGIIPKGEYGGGTVMLWDNGFWEPIGDPEEGIKKGNLKFNLHGERLHGSWALVRMKWHDKPGKNNWLLIKHDDEYAKIKDNDKFLKKEVTSIVSGRSMEEIAEAKTRIWKNKKAESKPKVIKEKKDKKSKNKVKFPAFKAPQLATLSDSTPSGKTWVHEIKFDGYRTIARINGDEVEMLTRTGLDWQDKYKALANELSEFDLDNAILDGEIIAVDKNGRSNFLELQERLKAEDSDKLQYYIFDILYLNGKDLTKLPLLERKEILEKLLKKNKSNNIFYSEHFEFKGDEFLDKLCSLNYEGIISKRGDRPYHSGRNKDWLKSKCHKRQEFVIGGYTLPSNNSAGIGAMLLGYYEKGKLIYCGKVGTGLTAKTSIEMRKKLEKLKQKSASFEKVSAIGKKGAIYVKPELVCEIEFTEWTTEGALRHPSFQGLREDKPAKQIGKDVAIHLDKKLEKPVEKKKTGKSKAKGRIDIGGISISHPERIVYPKHGITKLELAEYYDQIADYILPHIKNRFISVVRCPEGLNGECFFQRHEKISSHYILEQQIKQQNHHSPYIYIKDKKGLLTLIQFGVIEIHVWGSRIDKIEQPDRLIFDLDPDENVSWQNIIEAAAEVKLRMDDIGLESFLKTTGGKGLHVVVPFNRKYDWDVIKPFARAFADSMVSDNPNKYIANMSKAKRKGKIFIDYLRNDLTSTAIACYSARAREHATVSMPLSWYDLNAKLDPKKFTIETVSGLLEKQNSDPWEDIFEVKQFINGKILKDFGIKV